MAIQYSLFPDKTREMLIVDLETTGFLRQKGLIVEIGIAKLNLENGAVTPLFESLVREAALSPTHSRPPFGWIFENSTLSYAQVEEAPPLTDIFSQIQAIFDEYTAGVTAYNAAFDLPFLRSRSFSFKPLPCPMLAAAPVLNLPPARGMKDPKWPSVEEAWRYFFPQTPYVEQHRALDDALHEAKIVHELYKRGKYSLK